MELGRDKRTIDRGYRVLEADGWITRKKGGRNDPVTITLMIPAQDADIHRFGSKTGVGKRDIGMSHLEVVQTRHETGSNATSNGFKRDIQCVASKEQEEQEEQEEQRAATPPALVPVDRPVSREVVAGESAPDGALAYLLHQVRKTYALSPSEAESLRINISSALRVMPRDFVMSHIASSANSQDFLASLASANGAVSSLSSNSR